MKQFWILSVLAFCFFSQGCINPKATSLQGLPIVDLTKEYPEKEFLLGEPDRVYYIPLETTNDVLADEYFFIRYVSDNRIVGINGKRGDIFIFDRDGKVISSFNHTGNSGIDYLGIQSIVFDEKRGEVFVADYAARNRCLVYSEDGKFLRQFYFPDNSSIGYCNLYNFDDKTLFAYNRHRQNLDADEINQKTPYVFLSKEDGSVVSRVDVSFPKRIPEDRHYTEIENGRGRQTFSVSTTNLIKQGQEFIIADRSSDTIYLLTQDKKLTPLFVRTPSVFDTKKIIYLSVHFKTDRYIYFGTSSYDFTKVVERLKAGEAYGHLFTSRSLVYDLHTGEIFTPVRSPRSFVGDVPENTMVHWYSADRLIGMLESGHFRDESKLKEIAQAIKEEKEEVNPVVLLTKFR